MNKALYKSLNKLNKILLPSLTKKGVDPAKASKFQLGLLAWKYFILKKSLK